MIVDVISPVLLIPLTLTIMSLTPVVPPTDEPGIVIILSYAKPVPAVLITTEYPPNT